MLSRLRTGRTSLPHDLVSASSRHAFGAHGSERFRQCHSIARMADLRGSIGSRMNKHVCAIRKAGFDSQFNPTKP
jgi:hypothetical protein